MTPAEEAALGAALDELAEVAAQWEALALWERTRRQHGPCRPGLLGGRGLRQCRPAKPVPMPAARTDWSRTIPGMPCPKATVQTDEEPFPLCRVRHLPPPPSTPRPANFDRALTWTLKRWR